MISSKIGFTLNLWYLLWHMSVFYWVSHLYNKIQIVLIFLDSRKASPEYTNNFATLLYEEIFKIF